MSLRPKRLLPLSTILAISLSACNDTTNPFEGNFDADQAQASLQTVDDAFGTQAFESFSVLGAEFVVGGGAAAASVDLLASAADPHYVSLTQRAQLAAQEIAAAMAAPAAVLIPEEYRGLTYVYVPGEGYLVDPEATDGPDNGVRFILYTVNPITKEIAVPLDSIGYADLLDESTENEAAIRLRVVSGDVTYLDYVVSTSGPITSPTFTIAGSITDGVNVAEFTLSVAFEFTFAGATIDIDYDIAVNDSSIEIALHLEGDAEENSSATIDITFMHDGHEVFFTGSLVNDEGTLEVYADEQLFATITVTASSVEVLGADGEPLTQAEAQALRRFIELVDDVMDTFDRLFQPVEFLFSGP
ncbi:MAG: hypothetical protein AMS18_01695 [Gemmatimonas sp. SG8_17]|nr:MAG: hypothetical protein AMS18_01695 [Gemmatimonas sp. SG8_17]